MTSKLSIIIPSSIAWMRPFIEQKLIAAFGGYSVSPIRGEWRNRDGNVITEFSDLYFVIAELNQYQLRDFGQDISKYIKARTDEEEVLYWTEEVQR